MLFLFRFMLENEFSSLSYNVSIRRYVRGLRVRSRDWLSGVGKSLVYLIVLF